MSIEKKTKNDLLVENELFSVEKVKLTQAQGLHWHEFYEMEYIIEGSGKYIINGISYKIEPGVLFFSTPSDFQEITFDSATLIIKLQFLPEFIDLNLLKQLTGPMVLSDENNIFGNYIFQINNLMQNKSRYSSLFAMHTASLLYILIINSDNIIEGKQKYTINQHFHKLLTYINNHYTEELSLESLSKRINLSPDYVSTLFKKHSGQKISDYITTLRLNYAHKLIQNTDNTIIDICFLSGYNSYPHFIRAFKKKYGDSPNNIRKKSEYKSEDSL